MICFLPPVGGLRAGMGKGALRCPSREIFVWSIGLAPAAGDDYIAQSCTAEPAPAGAVVVCAHEAAGLEAPAGE